MPDMAEALRLRRDLSLPLPAPIWPPGYRLSPFTDDLAKQVHTLLADSYLSGEGTVPPFEEWWPALKSDSEFDRDLIFLAVAEDGALAGACQCWTSAFVKDLAVAAAHRRRGIGEALMMTAFLAFAQRGAKQVDLKVVAGNAPAIRLYQRLGMREA